MKIRHFIHRISFLCYMLLLTIEVAVALRRPPKIRTQRIGSHTPRPRVIYGQNDVNNDYPYVVSLEFEPSEYYDRGCTGSLIASQWVITAAHCCLGVLDFVRYGDMTIPKNESKLSKVIKEFPHPLHTRKRNDIALILIEAINLEFYGILHVADYKSFAGRVAVFAGYGKTFPMIGKVSHVKLVAEDMKPLQLGKGLVINEDFMKGFDGEVLRQMWIPKLTVVPKCDNRQQIPYAGDSGGPLIIDKRITGVVSGTVRRNSPHHTFYSFFTPVSPYIDWIRHTMAQKGST